MSQPRPQISDEDRIALRLFANRVIDREEAEERTGLHFSEMLILMGQLGIRRKKVGIHEGMRAPQVALFDRIFAP